MDIAKYIGLYLLKNEYCYLPGIGTLQIVKKAAGYDPETQQMNAPVYAVDFQLSSGSIDDSFANFIANNERISIAHASNYLKDFCAHAKQELKEHKEVLIPGIGKFNSNSEEKVEFVPDPHLQIKGRAIPFFKNSTSVEQKREDPITQIIERTSFKEPKADEEIVMQPPQVNWPKIIILIVVVLALLAAVIFLFNWSKDGSTDKGAGVENTVTPTEQQVLQNAASPQKQAAAPEEIHQTPADGAYMISINQYPTYQAASQRASQLTSYGNKVEVWTKDSTSFSVIMRFPAAVNADQAVDSLRRLFNPGGNVMVVE